MDEQFLSQDPEPAQHAGAEDGRGSAFDLRMDVPIVVPLVTGHHAAPGDLQSDDGHHHVDIASAHGTAAGGHQDGAAWSLTADAPPHHDGVDAAAGHSDWNLQHDEHAIAAHQDAGAGEHHDEGGGQSLLHAPDQVTSADVHQAAEDLSAQTHIQAGMHEMYNSIYHGT